MPIEGLFWVFALILLFMFEPASGSHVTICPLKLSGFEHCPGCGIGRSISLAMQGDLRGSFEYHMMGIPGLLIIGYRIFDIFKNYLTEHGKGNRITSRT